MPEVSVRLRSTSGVSEPAVLPYEVTGGITNGRDIPALSDDAEAFLEVPAFGTLPAISGRTFTDGEVIEGVQINGQLRIAAGARVIVRDSCIVNSLGSSGYLVRINEGGGAWLTMERCNLIQRTFPNKAKCIAGWGDVNLEIRECVIRGGTDSIHFNPTGTPGQIPTGDPDLPMARLLVEDTWIGELERVAAVHIDGMQFHDQGRGHHLVRRARIMGYCHASGEDPLTTRITDLATAPMGSTCIIVTKSDGTSHDVKISRCWFEGGNYMVQLNDMTGWNEVSDSWFGLRCRYGPLAGGGFTSINNRWGQTGTVTAVSGSWEDVMVTDGDLIGD